MRVGVFDSGIGGLTALKKIYKHYPIIKEDINKYFNNQVKLLDMSELLLDKLDNDNKSSINIYYSKLNDTIINNTKKILDIENLYIYEK